MRAPQSWMIIVLFVLAIVIVLASLWTLVDTWAVYHAVQQACNYSCQ